MISVTDYIGRTEVDCVVPLKTYLKFIIRESVL